MGMNSPEAIHQILNKTIKYMMQEQITKLQDGREIKHIDTIHHHTDTHFDFMDRVRILFTGKCRVHSEIYTGEICHVKGSKATVYVPPIFKKKDRLVGLVSNRDFVNTQKR